MMFFSFKIKVVYFRYLITILDNYVDDRFGLLVLINIEQISNKFSSKFDETVAMLYKHRYIHGIYNIHTRGICVSCIWAYAHAKELPSSYLNKSSCGQFIYIHGKLFIYFFQIERNGYNNFSCIPKSFKAILNKLLKKNTFLTS